MPCAYQSDQSWLCWQNMVNLARRVFSLKIVFAIYFCKITKNFIGRDMMESEIFFALSGEDN